MPEIKLTMAKTELPTTQMVSNQLSNDISKILDGSIEMTNSVDGKGPLEEKALITPE